MIEHNSLPTADFPDEEIEDEDDPIHGYDPKVTFYGCYVLTRYWKCFVLGSIVLLVIPSILLFGWLLQSDNKEMSSDDTIIEWESEINSSAFNSECSRTRIFPFKQGCPEKCNRTDIQQQPQPLYRLRFGWNFGEPNASRVGTGYPFGINFQSIPVSFVNEFETLALDLKTKASTEIGGKVGIKEEPVIHISLSYLCCLTEQESIAAEQLLYQWTLDHYPFDIPIGYDNVICLQERYNSVTNILLVDEKTQHRLMKLNHNVSDYLQSNGIPVLIQREKQMRFHTTLLGLYYGDDPETDLPENDISKNLTKIANIVSTVKHGPFTKGMHIQHTPKIGSCGSYGSQHAGPT